MVGIVIVLLTTNEGSANTVLPAETSPQSNSVHVTRPAAITSRYCTPGVGYFRERNRDLRHTYASWLVRAGVALLEVSKLGHSTIERTERYAHLAPENLKAGASGSDRLRSSYAPDE